MPLPCSWLCDVCSWRKPPSEITSFGRNDGRPLADKAAPDFDIFHERPYSSVASAAGHGCRMCQTFMARFEPALGSRRHVLFSLHFGTTLAATVLYMYCRTADGSREPPLGRLAAPLTLEVVECGLDCKRDGRLPAAPCRGGCEPFGVAL